MSRLAVPGLVTAALALALAAAAPPRAAEAQKTYMGRPPAPSTHVHAGSDTLPIIEVHPLRPGVYAAKVNFVWAGWVELSDGILVVDGGHNDTAARVLADTIRARSGSRPFRYLVCTHAHTDHVAAARYFSSVGATIVAHRSAIAEIERRVATEAAPLRGSEKIAAFRPSWIRVDRRTTLGKGSQLVEVIQLGSPAHTRADMIVYLPKRRILFSGDIVTYQSIPWMLDPGMEVRGWQASLDSLDTKRFAADSLVPGHGVIAPAAKAIAYTRNYLRALSEKAVKEAGWKTNLELVRAWGDLGQFQGQEFYDEVHFLNLKRLYNQALGKPTPGRSRPGVSVKH